MQTLILQLTCVDGTKVMEFVVFNDFANILMGCSADVYVQVC